MATKRPRSGLVGGLRLLAVTTLIGAALIGVIGGVGRAAAQEAPAATTATPTVTVVGHGSVTVTPDLASVSLGVTVTETELADAQRKATRVMTKIIAAVKAAGVEEADIQTSYYSVYAMTRYDDTGTPLGVSGYQVSNQVNVTVRDLDAVGSLLEDAVAAGANTIYGVTFGVADTSKAESEARAEAVTDAKAVAEELAKAAGLTLGPLVSMSEGILQTNVYAYGQGAGGAGGPPIEAGGLQVTVDVVMTFELK
jgi:uncharacterized protein YggE